MKLRAVRLENVRRFVDPVAIEDIGDGLNVVCEANEVGKSTIVEALSAALFWKHTSWRKEQAARLVPHAGGDPRIAVDIELAGERFTVEKEFSAKPNRRRARILRSGVVLRQGDDAEAWLDERVRASEGGAAEFLWVRQGEAQRLCGGETARKSALNRIAGEVEAVTGAERLDAVRRDVAEALAAFQTPTRQVKAGGPLAQARARANELAATRERLAARVAALTADLATRDRLQRALAELDDPLAEAERADRLAAATQAFREAEARAAEVAAAAVDAETTGAMALAAAERRDALAQAIEAAAKAHVAHRATQAAEHADAAARQSAEAVAHAAALRRDGLVAAHRAAQAMQRATMAAAADAANAARRGDLDRRLAQAEAAERDAAIAAADAKACPDAAILAALFERAAALEAAQRAHALGAPTLTMAFAGATHGVAVDGRPLEDGVALPVPDGALVEIAGVGTLTVRPGAGGSGRSVAAARDALAVALAAAGLADMAAAREADARRRNAEERRREAAQRLLLAAPEGIAPLRRALAALPAPCTTSAELPTRSEAEIAERCAAAAADDAVAAAAAAQRDADGARDVHTRSLATLDAARRQADEAVRALAAWPDPAAELAGRAAAATQRTAAAEAARLRHAALGASVPDLAALRREAERWRSVVAAVLRERQSTREELSGVRGRIAACAGEAVVEELAAAEEAHAAAAKRLAAAEAEWAMLQLLDAQLAAAQKAAVDRWLAPVLAEIGPLVAAVFPDATVTLDPDTALPVALTREFAEGLDVLSGGTQEQVALLVRLAFARMLARTGTVLPVILDDAIAYSDDERIEALFRALHRVAGDLQIIVFSCRGRAFRDLGGRRLTLTRRPQLLALAAE